jgi:small subunit ribosomal protein S21
MLIIKVESGESIERAVKRLKRKYDNAKIGKELRERKEFKKKSVKRRAEISKATYINKKRPKDVI